MRVKVKNYDKALYPSVNDAILEILDKHLTTPLDAKVPVYGAGALDEICFFLASNNIEHFYTVTSVPTGAEGCEELVSLVWTEPGAVGNEIWYARIGNEIWYARSKKNSLKGFRVSLIAFGQDKEEIEDWISNIEEIDIADWSVEEV